MTGMALKMTATLATPHVERRVALWTLIGFWAFYFILITARMAIVSRENQFDMMGRRTGVVLLGIVLSLIMYAVLRSLKDRSMRTLLTAAFLVSIPASIAKATNKNATNKLIAPTTSMMNEVAQM